MRKSNPVKVLLIVILIVALCGTAFFLATKIVGKMLSPAASTERSFQETAEAEDEENGKETLSPGNGVDRSDPEVTDTARLDVTNGESGIEGFEHCYLVAKLNEDMRENFIALYRSVEAFEDVCDLPHLCTGEEAAMLVELLHSECPELIQFDNSESYYTTSMMGKVDTISVPYSMGMTQYIEERKQCEEEVARIVAIASEEVTDYKRELAAYREFCRGTVYDLTTDRCSLSVGPLVEKRGKCDGISLGFKWIMDELGIPCIVVSGDNKTPGEIGHAWNMIMIDGIWYCLDVTAEWSEEGRNSYLYPAFNMSENWEETRYTIGKTYEALGVPHCTTMEGSYHVKNGSYVPTGSNARETFEKLMGEALFGTGVCLVQFEDPTDWKSFNDESAGWVNLWMEENGIYGTTNTLTIPTYQVAEVRMNINQYSGQMNLLLPQINELKADLQQRSVELDDKKAEVNDLVSRANAIADELTEMEQYAYVDDAYFDRYNTLLEEYNFLAEEYRRAYEEYDQMRQQYNADCDRLQNMIEEYNRMVQQQ